MSQILKVLYDGDFKIQEVTYGEGEEHEGETYILTGYCCQCGECCYNKDENGNITKCDKLIYETIDGIVKYRCSIYQTRPMCCMLYPSTQEEIDQYPGCTLKYIKK